MFLYCNKVLEKTQGLSNTHEWSRVDSLVKTTHQVEVGSWFLWKCGNRELLSEAVEAARTLEIVDESRQPFKFVTSRHKKSRPDKWKCQLVRHLENIVHMRG